MKRHLCTFMLALVALSFSQNANAHDLIQVAQNGIRLWGSWKITKVTHEDDFSMTIHRSTGTTSKAYDEDGPFPPILIDDNDAFGWSIDFGDGGTPGDATAYVEVRTVNGGDPETYEVAIEITHGGAVSPYDDVVLRFEQTSHVTGGVITPPPPPPPPTSCAIPEPILTSPERHPEFSISGSVALYTWGELGNPYPASPLTVEWGPFVGEDPLGLAVSAVGQSWGLGPFGILDGAMNAESRYGLLRAYARLQTSGYPKALTDATPECGDDGYIVRAAAGAADLFLFGNDVRPITLTDERHAVFTFDIHGATPAAADHALAMAGFFIRGTGQPCPINHTTCTTRLPENWELIPEGTAHREIPVDFISGQLINGAVEVAAVAVVGSDPASDAATFDASAVADFSATAVLKRIQLFEGTAENPGREIKGFTVTSTSGHDYSRYIIDTTPPTTTMTVAGASGNQDWYRSEPTIFFLADDEDGSATTTSFSIDSGPAVTYSAPVMLQGDGVHRVVFFSVDAANNQEAPNMMLIKVDSTAPSIALPAAMTVQQTSANGAVVAYASPSVSDDGSGVAASSCAPTSGSTFPVGVTPVTCTATDVAGNTNSGTFSVTVQAVNPDAAPDGRMFGVGFVIEDGAHHHFAFRVSQTRDHDFGRLEYWVSDPRHCAVDDDADFGSHVTGEHDDDYQRSRSGSRKHFTATSMTTVTFSDDPGFQPTRGARSAVDTVRVVGVGSWNGHRGYTFEAIAADHGEPGRGRDGFTLVVKDPTGAIVAKVDGPLSRGNVQSYPVVRSSRP